MFEGIQFHLLLGETTTTSCLLPSLLFAWRAAVCPAIPAPSISKRAIVTPKNYFLGTQNNYGINLNNTLIKCWQAEKII
jgi:hypothetical protein